MSSPRSILVVDDEEALRTVLSSELSGEGYQVESAGDGDEAISIIEKKQFDLVLLDIKMPKMSGLDAITSIKSITPATQVIMLTSYDLDENIRTAMNRGASGYLLKSCTPVEIIDAIEKAQKGDSPIDMTITKRVMDAFLRQSSDNRYSLTSREKDILQYLASDLTVQDVASKLNLSYFTVDTHIKNIYEKLNVHNRQGLVTKASKERLI